MASDPRALVAWFSELKISLTRVGLEARPLSQWLYKGLKEVGFAVELQEIRHVRTAFKTMPVKTYRKDARGMAQRLRMGWFWPVLTVRKLIQGKLTDRELSLRGIPRGFGLKVGATARRRFPGRVRELVGDHPTLQMITEALLSVREELDRQFAHIEVEVRNLARQDQRVRLLRSTPGLVPLWH